MNSEIEIQLKKTHQLTILIYFNFVGSIFIYGLLSHILNKQSFAPSPSPSSVASLNTIGLIISAVMVLISFTARNMIRAKLGMQDPARTTPLKYHSIFMISSLAGFAFSEIPALLGFVFFFLTAKVQNLYPYLIISAAALFLHFPNLSQWEEWVENNSRKNP